MVKDGIRMRSEGFVPDKEPTKQEQNVCATFIMFYGASAGDPVKDTTLAERALDFYAQPDNHRILREWIQELGVGVYSNPDPMLLDKCLTNLAKRAPKKAEELRSLGWDIPHLKKKWFRRWPAST